MRKSMKLTWFHLLVVLQATIMEMPNAHYLQYNFYSTSCPEAEETVRKVVGGMISDDPSQAAPLIRLFFHDCFVRGCDASILLDPSPANRSPEKTAIPLRGYDAINKIKAAVEEVCAGKVSCADIIAFAARDAAFESGGFYFPIPSGRRDGNVSKAFDVLLNMPSPFFELQDLVDNFANKNLTVDDLVALSGAHSIGSAHCSGFDNRLYPTVDPAMNATYAAQLKKTCPDPSSSGERDPVVNNRVVDPNTLSNQYYKNLNAGQVLFTSDAGLATATTRRRRWRTTRQTQTRGWCGSRLRW